MIQNLIIIKDGSTLLSEDFGSCHSLQGNPVLLSGFFDALVTFSEEFEQGILEQLRFKNANVNFLKSNGLLYIIVSDLEDSLSSNTTKLRKIASLFFNEYGKHLVNFTGEITFFNKFKDTLLDLGIAQKNCGKHSECTECQNNSNPNPILDEILKLM
ncbi:MAG: hypothetical protein FK732_08315 [Asgard group archaeon]|nr:hypothetical protein [Asgard group archaeon]